MAIMSDERWNHGSGREVVLITGSNGTIGTALSRKLSAHFHVMGLDKDPPKSAAPIQHVHLDLTSLDSLDTALKFVQATHGTRIASVVHLATHYDYSGRASALYDTVTVRGTEALLSALRRFDVEQFVFASTMLVHAPGAPLDETSPLGPTWAYPEAQLRAEDSIRRHRGDLRVATLRLAGVYDDECHSLPLARQIQRIYEKRLLSYVFSGNPEHGQAMLHVDDAADALAVTVARRSVLPVETTLLIGEESAMSHAELQRTLSELIHGTAWETWAMPESLTKVVSFLRERLPYDDSIVRPWIVDRVDGQYELDTRRARDLIGWSALHRLRDSLPRMVELLSVQPEFFYETNQLVAPSWLKPSSRRRPRQASSRHLSIG